MQHHLIKVLAVGLLSGLAWTTSAYGTPGERFHIKEDNTGIHEGPSATASVVKHLNKGDRVIEFRRHGSWVKVSQLGAVGKDGWVEISRLAPEPRNIRREQVARVIETPPKITPDKIRPGEAITPDTIRPGKCPAFDSATIDACFGGVSSSRSSGYRSGTGTPVCLDVPRKPSTYVSVSVEEFDTSDSSFGVPTQFSVRVHNGRATLSCGISKRVTRSQAHRCRKEILLSGAWGFCYSKYPQPYREPTPHLIWVPPETD